MVSDRDGVPVFKCLSLKSPFETPPESIDLIPGNIGVLLSHLNLTLRLVVRDTSAGNSALAILSSINVANSLDQVKSSPIY